MNRKIIVGLLCLLLAASSCRRQPMPEKNTDADETPSAATETTEETNPNVFRLKDGLPDIGQYRSDFSYTYFDGVSHDVFTPRDDYGTLLPFTDRAVSFTSPDHDPVFGSAISARVGLCTEDGKVVLDARYEYIDSYTSKDGASFYKLTMPQEVLFDEEGNVDYGSETVAPEEWLIPSDGSWCLPLTSIPHPFSVGVMVAGGNIVLRYEKTDYTPYFEAYDYDGNKLFATDRYEQLEPCANGLFCVNQYDIRKMTYTGVFLDRAGDVIFDGLGNIGPFNENGIAPVQTPGGKYTLMDDTGNYLFAPEFDSMTTAMTDEPYFCGVDETNGFSYLFDMTGKSVKTINGTVAGGCIYGNDEDGFVYETHTSDGVRIAAFPGDGIIVSRETGKQANTLSYPSREILVTSYYTDGDTEVLDREGNVIGHYTSYRDEQVVYTDCGVTIFQREKVAAEDEDGVIYASDEDTVFADSETGEELYVLPYGTLPWGYKHGDRFVYVAYYPDRTYNSARYMLYDLTSRRVVFEDCMIVRRYTVGEKDLWSVVTENQAGLYDSDMNVILRRSLFND